MKQTHDGWSKILAGLRALDDTVTQVGWFEEDAATIAFINDRGGNRGDNPPPRPVLGPGMDIAGNAIDAAMAAGVNKVLRGAGPSAARDAAERAGALGEQGVRDAIDAVAPPNADSTIAGKHGYSAPLRGFSPDRIWNKLEHRVVSSADAGDDEVIG